jgi:hypothetical protein
MHGLYAQLNQHFLKMDHLLELVDCRQVSSGYGRFWKGHGVEEGVGRIVAWVLGFPKKLSKVRNSNFVSLSRKIKSVHLMGVHLMDREFENSEAEKS